MDETFYKVIVIILTSIFMIIKIQLTKKYVKSPEQGNNYPLPINIFLGINAIVMLFPYLLIFPEVDVLQMNIPEFLRILGSLDYVLVIIIMYWQMKTLGVNISSNHEQRKLITDGPYKYVRHPLYLIFIAMSVDIWLVGANWLLLIGIPMTIIAGIFRAGYEEKLLISEYGEEYIQYKSEVGQLFPKIF